MLDVGSIPPALRRSTDALAARIEDASLAVAQPAQQAFHDGWLLRYSAGKAKRARSINAIGAGVLPVGEKIAYCMEFYARHRMQCLFRITPFSQPLTLDGELESAGFVAVQDTRVMRLDLRAADTGNGNSARWIDVEQFAAAFGRMHKLDASKTAAERERFARSGIETAYIAHFESAEPVACGCVAIDGEFAGIFGMVTAESHRGRGIATGLVDALLITAKDEGAHTAYLQVEANNAPARRAYAKFGFEDCYSYWYRCKEANLDR